MSTEPNPASLDTTPEAPAGAEGAEGVRSAETSPARVESHPPTVPSLVAPAVQVPSSPFGASFGWFLVTAATVLLAFSSFDLYNDQASGMWAGYRDLALVIVLGYSLALLRCDVPRTPFIGLCGICGVLLILEGVFLAETTAIIFTEVATGIVMVLGVAFMASASES